MMPVDVVILEVLSESDLELTPNNVARNADYDNDYVRQRLKVLLDEGFVSQSSGAGDPFYEITDAGRDYLREQEEG